MKTGAVIVAAGMSTRMNEFKQLMKIGDLTIVERVVLNFLRVGIKEIVVVTGYRAEQVEKALYHKGITFLRNENYENSQMLDSAKIGLAYLKDRCDQVFFCPVDVPFFTEETMKKLISQHGSIVVPKCRNKLGHPIKIKTLLIPAILDYQGEGGLRGALDSLNIEFVSIPVQDEGILMDLDTPEDYQQILELYDSKLIHPQVKVWLAKNKPFFGPGTAVLLKEIDRNGFVREACAKTGISYSKGWSIIRSAEEELGYKIVERQPGGRNGGRACVTEAGKEVLRLFEVYEEKLEESARKIFEKIFLESDL